jgi:hypothetical protein
MTPVPESHLWANPNGRQRRVCYPGGVGLASGDRLCICKWRNRGMSPKLPGRSRPRGASVRFSNDVTSTEYSACPKGTMGISAQCIFSV